MSELFLGTEAVAAGDLTPYRLRTLFRPVLPNVYVPAPASPSLRTRIEAAWLWSRRRGTIAGLAASAMHGSRWIDEDVPVEVIWRNPHPPSGVITRNFCLGEGEAVVVGRLPVTSLVRTAFDIGRILPRGEAVARLDALIRATPYRIEDVSQLAERYPGARGIRQLREVLPLVDGGAASPKESWLRLLLIDAGLPVPMTQIPVEENRKLVAVLDMGWERFRVAVEYDGDQHRSNRRQYVRDIDRLRTLERMGWIVVRVIAEDRPEDVVRRVREALHSRGFRDT